MRTLCDPVSGTTVDVPDTDAQLLAYYRGEGYLDATDLERATPLAVADADFNTAPAVEVDETDMEHSAVEDQAHDEPESEDTTLDLG
jgi:hypothetical protein